MKDNHIKHDTPLWEIQNISMYGIPEARLKNLSINISRGITAIIGPSGAGKSSLLNILVGFENIDSGKIHRSEDTHPYYWIPQNHGLWANLNVKEHLTAMMQKPDNKKIEKIMEQFEISHKSKAYPSHLSKGEQSRLAMARALIVPPKVLIMDEPLINLPPSKQMHYWHLLTDMAEKHSISLIYATHSPKYVIGTADNVICLKDGQILYSGSVEELYHYPDSFELGEYLGDINWFTEDDKIFIPTQISDISLPFGVRPEEVGLQLCSNGKFKIIRSIFRGEVTETTIKATSGKEFSLLHREPIDLKSAEFCTLILNKTKKS